VNFSGREYERIIGDTSTPPLSRSYPLSWREAEAPRRPSEAFDLLLARIRELQEQIDGLKEQVAALQERESHSSVPRPRRA
jgi:hypothetical protein